MTNLIFRRLIYFFKTHKIKNRFIASLPIVFCFLFFCFIAINAGFARPGGGQSYSSGGSSGGGSDGIEGALIELLIYILIEVLPAEVSIPLVIIIVIIYWIAKWRKKRNKRQAHSAPTYTTKRQTVLTVDRQIEASKQLDPNFSKVLLLDFISLLFHKYYAFAGSSEFKKLHPFFNASDRGEAAKYKNQKITEIVIGNISIKNISDEGENQFITTEIEANYTVANGSMTTRYITSERWLLMRKAGVISKAPEAMQTISCPNCGSPANFNDAGICIHCNTFITSGEMQWVVARKSVLFLTPIKANSLATYKPEKGTNFPTVKQVELNNNIEIFQKRHPEASWSKHLKVFTSKIVSPFFTSIYAAWSNKNWQQVRHLVSDRLYESNKFWIDTYTEANLTNKLEKINISSIELARIDLDKYYEAFTIRIFASCLDYTINDNGKTVGGSKRKIRKFSEYWTFIRRTGISKSTNDFDMRNCPNCGAPADKMGQSAVCGYCQTKISTGEYSWVLSMITQDEVYSG